MSLGKCLCSLKEFYINIQTTVRLAHQNTTVPADLLLVRGTCIDDVAMFSVNRRLSCRNQPSRINRAVGGGCLSRRRWSAQNRCATWRYQGPAIKPRESLRVRPMVVALRLFFAPVSALRKASLFAQCFFGTERVSANNLESFLLIGFLLIFAIAASWYVWMKGITRGLKKSKLLDCIMIITSFVPPE